MFRLINVEGRAALQIGDAWHDLAALAGVAALRDPLVAIERHRELHALAERAVDSRPTGRIDDIVLGPPVPMPRQVFAIGLNYHEHAAESSMELPPAPLTFAKFPACITGPTADVELSGELVDWEVEIVAVVGQRTRHVDVEHALESLAGLTLGQDISDRVVQFTGAPPQFGLGKSFSTYGPIGPAVVSLDSFEDPDDIALWCDVNAERMQSARTSELIFSIPVLVAYLSSICELLPGDLIFTGTPSGIGAATGRFLREGDVITSGADVIGAMSNTCVPGRGPLSIEH